MGVFQQTGHWYGTFAFQTKRFRGVPLHRFHPEGREPLDQAEADEIFDTYFKPAVRKAVRNGTALFPEQEVGATMFFGAFIEYYVKHFIEERNLRGAMDPAILNVLRRDAIAKLPLKALESAPPILQLRKRLRESPITLRTPRKDGTTKIWTLKRKRKNKTVNKFMVRLKHMLNFAVASDLMASNPFVKDPTGLLQKLPAQKGGRRRRITSAEEKALRANILEPIMADRLDVALGTGLRRAEMQGLQFKHIDFEKWLIKLEGVVLAEDEEGYEIEAENTKSGEGREIPMHKELQALFTKRRDVVKKTLFGKAVPIKATQLDEAYVFGLDDGAQVLSFKRAWNSLKKRAHLDKAALRAANKMDLHWHDLRGEACTRMLERGKNPMAIMKIMGHSDLKITIGHYTGDMEAAMRDAVEATAR